MHDHKRCPECDGLDTEVVFTEDWNDQHRKTRICNECPTEWVVSYGNPRTEDVRTHE